MSLVWESTERTCLTWVETSSDQTFQTHLSVTWTTPRLSTVHTRCYSRTGSVGPTKRSLIALDSRVSHSKHWETDPPSPRNEQGGKDAALGKDSDLNTIQDSQGLTGRCCVDPSETQTTTRRNDLIIFWTKKNQRVQAANPCKTIASRPPTHQRHNTTIFWICSAPKITLIK